MDWMKGMSELWIADDCKVIDQVDFPEENRFVGYFLGSANRTNDMILGLIQGQNIGINTTAWKVINRVEEKTCANLLIEIDDDSVARLTELNFIVDYDYGQKVKLTRKGKRKAEANNAADNNPQASRERRFPQYMSRASTINNTGLNNPSRQILEANYLSYQNGGD